jgi:hypothetical protein
MLIKACFECKFHEIKQEEAQKSYCLKECCWSQYSRCITQKAVEKFLNEEYIVSIHK